jgi:hypothetical protein
MGFSSISAAKNGECSIIADVTGAACAGSVIMGIHFK